MVHGGLELDEEVEVDRSCIREGEFPDEVGLKLFELAGDVGLVD